MPRSKIIYGDEVLIDLTGDTVTAGTLAEGVTAHDKAGNAITGTLVPENLDDVLTEQESIIDQMQAALKGKASAGGVKLASGTITTNSKTVTITGLGFTPQHAMLAANSLSSGLLNPIICAFNNKAVYDYSSGLKSVNATFTFTNGGFTVVSGGTGGGYSFAGGYTWIAWAE